MDLKKSYYEDVKLFKNRSIRFWSATLLLVLLMLPLMVKSYHLFIINQMLINIIIVLGLNILVGNTGQISLGHAGFVAIGSYTTVLLMMKMSIPFPFALVIAGFTAAAFGLLLGIPALRLEGPYLAIATLGFGLSVTVIIGRLEAFGGHMGLVVPKLHVGSFVLNTSEEIYFMVLGLTVLSTLFARSLIKSRIGRAFHAIRDSDIAASTVGVDLVRYKTLSFAISAFFAGIAGGLWAFILGFIHPGLYNLYLSIYLLAMVVVGGLGTVTGSILGAIVVTFLNLQSESLQNLPILGPVLQALSENIMSVPGLPNVNWVFMGLTIIVIVIFEPLGLFGIWMRVKIYWKSWPF